MFVALLWLSILVLVGVLSLLICRCLPCLLFVCGFVVVSMLLSCCCMLLLCCSVVVVLCWLCVCRWSCGCCLCVLVSLLILPLLMLLISGCFVRALVVVLLWCVIVLRCALDHALC